jgi:sugar O-acyltransferase (sialic acid O-acetyltransferase NeuD family)
MKRVLVVGASGQARVAVDTMEEEGSWEIVGLADSFRPLGPTALGYDVVGRVEEFASLMETYRADAAFVAVGDNWTRGKLTRQIGELVPGIPFATTVHPSATVARSTHLGEGVIVMAGACVMPGSEAGPGAMVGTKASLDHDASLGEFASLGPGAVTGGNVRIGAYTAVALGAKVIHGICIGPQSVIGAGSTVLADIPANVVAYGTPARVVRQREASERYL